MKIRTALALICFSLFTPSLIGQTPPSIPEEARKHFVMGETIFKEAKSVDNFALAVNEFAQAARLAPEWPEARFNLGLAREAAGDFPGAIADLKIYQQFKLSETEARTVQDKIYAIEAKQRLKVSDASAKADAEAALAKAKERQFIGKWFYWYDSPTDNFIEISGPSSATLSDGFFAPQSSSEVRVTGSVRLSGFQIRDRSVRFTVTQDQTWIIKRNSSQQHRIRVLDFDLTISDDARILKGTIRDSSSIDGQASDPNSIDIKFLRRD